MPFLYASGYFGISMLTQVVVTWLMFFYCPPVGAGRIALLPATTFGLMMAAGRLVDAIADPLVAAWSDNTRTAWGRRRPFIAAGMLPVFATFVLLWHPPALSASGTALYLALMLGAFFTSLTVVACPFLALLPEITPAGTNRLRVSSFMALFYMAGLAVGLLGSSLLVDTVGFGVMGIVLGALATASFLGPVLGARELPSVEVGERPGILAAMRTAMANSAFRPYIMAQPFFWFGFNMILMGLPYIVTLQLQLPAAGAGLLLVSALAVALLSMPVVMRMSHRLGKKRAFGCLMFICLLLVLMLPTVGRFPQIPAVIHGGLLIALAGFPIAGLFILPNTLVADIADYGYARTGIHQEGMYFGIQGLVLKAAISLAALALGGLLERFGYALDGFGGVTMIGPAAALSIGIGLIVFSRYPLTR